MQVPDAVYHLMRHTELKRCNLSGNVITKIPPKFAVKFSLITGKLINTCIRLNIRTVNIFVVPFLSSYFQQLRKISSVFFFLFLFKLKGHCNTNSNA